MNTHPGHILLNPRITEKAAALTEKGCYVFVVSKDASARDVASAIRSTYKVTPRKVTLLSIPRKRTVARGTGKAGQTRVSGKKAYIYLKKGDTIELA